MAETATRIAGNSQQYFAQTVKDLSAPLLRALHEYLEQPDEYERLRRRLAKYAVALQAPETQINLYHENDLLCLRDLVGIEVEKLSEKE